MALPETEDIQSNAAGEDRILELGLEGEFLAIVAHLRRDVPGFKYVEVRPHYDYSPDGGTHLMLNIYREETEENPPTMQKLARWVKNNLSASAAEWFWFMEYIEYFEDELS